MLRIYHTWLWWLSETLGRPLKKPEISFEYMMGIRKNKRNRVGNK